MDTTSSSDASQIMDSQIIDTPKIKTIKAKKPRRNRPVGPFTLTCVECGSTFVFPRKKKICGPECATKRQKNQTLGWVSNHPESTKVYQRRHHQKAVAEFKELRAMRAEMERVLAAREEENKSIE